MSDILKDIEKQIDMLTKQREDTDLKLVRLYNARAAMLGVAPDGATDAVRFALQSNPAQRMTPRDIRDFVKSRGFDDTGYLNFMAVVHTILFRLHVNQEIVKYGNGRQTTYQWVDSKSSSGEQS